ncbi:hypothetical protein AB1Y20_000502 [Prymnesium parvum]|uniref:3'-5' exonuclease n=1 Tax=Prymnesium parvum TaxID=97485 RepID=A0AB34K8M0_PRYPA
MLLRALLHAPPLRPPPPLHRGGALRLSTTSNEDAKSFILRVCVANCWPPPSFSTFASASASGGFECALTLHDGPLRGRTFRGRGGRIVRAESSACAAARRVLRPQLAAARGARGSLAKLRELCVREGLQLTREGASVVVGGKERVLALRACGVGRGAWWGGAVRAAGVGECRKSCLDEAARRVLALLRQAEWARWRPAEDAAPTPITSSSFTSTSSTPTAQLHCVKTRPRPPHTSQHYRYTHHHNHHPAQEVTATEDADVCDGWLVEHVLGSSAPAAVALDCEWPMVRSTTASERAAIVQLATAEHCLVFSLAHGMPALLREALRSPQMAIKVGKALGEDWKVLSPLLQHTCSSMEECGWFELTDFMPLASKSAPIDALARTVLRRSYALKGTVDHRGWDRWPLDEMQLEYAASDVCVIVDMLHALTQIELATKPTHTQIEDEGTRKV